MPVRRPPREPLPTSLRQGLSRYRSLSPTATRTPSTSTATDTPPADAPDGVGCGLPLPTGDGWADGRDPDEDGRTDGCGTGARRVGSEPTITIRGVTVATTTGAGADDDTDGTGPSGGVAPAPATGEASSCAAAIAVAVLTAASDHQDVVVPCARQNNVTGCD